MPGSPPPPPTDGSTTKPDDVAAANGSVEDAGDPAVGTANGVGLVMLKTPNGLSVKRLCPMSNGLKTRDRTFTVPRVVAGWSWSVPHRPTLASGDRQHGKQPEVIKKPWYAAKVIEPPVTTSLQFSSTVTIQLINRG
jgi:hypothetical protein